MTVRVAVLIVSLLAADVLSAGPQGRGNPRQAITTSVDVAWLEQLAASDAAARQHAEPANWSAKSARAEAYARLGALGTPEGLAAVARVDASRRQMPLLVESVSLEGRWTHPAMGMTDPYPFPITTVGPDGRTYAIVISDLLGGRSVYLLQQIPGAPGRWTRPRLASRALPTNGWFPPVLTAPTAGELLVTFTQPPNANNPPQPPPEPERVVIADVLRDLDGDGWTDLEEIRLGLNPASADTDGDGLPDGRDACPSYAPPGGEESDEDAEILRRAIFAHLGLPGSPWALLVDGTSRKLQLTGFGGPVIFDRAVPKRDEPGGGVYVRWQLVSKTADQATVSIADWEGSLAGSGHTVSLRRINGAWYVVAIRMTYIS
jgi:hypothetical protein